MKSNRLYWGGLLIFVGILALMLATGLINEGFIDVLFTFWPIILIALGFNMLVKRWPVVKLSVWAAVFLFLLYVGYNRELFPNLKSFEKEWLISLPQTLDLTNQITQTYQTDTATQGKLVVKANAIEIRIDPSEGLYSQFSYLDEVLKLGTETTEKQVVYSLETRDQDLEASPAPDEDGKSNSLFKSISGELKANLDESIPWHIEINASLLSSELLLAKLSVEALKIHADAGEIDIQFGDKVPHVHVDIAASAASINLEVPEGSGIRIVKDGLLTNVDYSGALNETSDGFESSNFETSPKKFTFIIRNTIGNIKIEEIDSN